MTAILGFLIIIGVLVFLHELGHFVVAKLAGVRVDKFSIGFPPKLWSFRRGETEYVISATPLGGYVRLAGEDPDEVTGDPRELHSKPIPVRLAIFLAGPIMNLAFAVVFLSLVFLIGIQVPVYREQPVVVGWVFADSPAAAAGLSVGDSIVAVDGDRVATWAEFEARLAELGESPPISLTVEREGQVREQRVAGQATAAVPLRGIAHRLDPVIGSLVPGYPAAAAGLREGDRVVSVDGVPMRSWYEMAEAIHRSAGQAKQLTVRRADQELRVEVTPVVEGERGLIGIGQAEETVLKRYGPLTALVRGAARTWELTVLTVNHLARLFTGAANLSTLGGPIMIGQAAGYAARAGVTPFLALMGFISLQLGLLNLLPIPILDGGHVFFLAVEAIVRRPVSVRFREVAAQVGIVLLATLMLYVFYNDLRRLISPDLWPF